MLQLDRCQIIRSTACGAAGLIKMPFGQAQLKPDHAPEAISPKPYVLARDGTKLSYRTRQVDCVSWRSPRLANYASR